MTATTIAAPRRSQEERTRKMQKRLLKATIDCLEKYGYAGTTISSIVAEAGVSRGAHLHHFESKAALIRAAADDLMRTIFKRLGDAVMKVEHADKRLQALIEAIWNDVFLTRDGKVVLELLMAARTDRELAAHLGDLSPRIKEMYAAAARYYFKAKPNAGIDVEDIIYLTQWQLRGMLLDAPITRDRKALREQLNVWIAVMDRLIAPRQNISGPPPRPEWWDTE